jgi:hypothetical protein
MQGRMMTLDKAMIVCLLVSGCAGAAMNGEPPDLDQGTTEVWFAGHVNSRLAYYDRVRTRPIHHEGRDALHTVTDVFRSVRDGGKFVLRTTVEEWTEPDGRLIRLRACIRGESEVEVVVGGRQMTYKTRRGADEMKDTTTEVPEGQPVYASLHSFLSSSRFRAAGFRPGLKHDFMEANPFGGHPLSRALEPRDKPIMGMAGFEFGTRDGILVNVATNFAIQRITYSRTGSVFAAPKPDVELHGDASRPQAEVKRSENTKENTKSNQEPKATGEPAP